VAFLESIGTRIVYETGKGILLALPNAIKKRQFASFFGRSAISGNHAFAVLDPYRHPLPRVGNRYVKEFLGRRADQPLVGEDYVLGVNVVRVVSYISALFSQFRSGGKSIPFVTDVDVVDKWDGTFLCFGSSDSNIKTLDVESLPQQTFYSWEFGQSGHRCIRAGGKVFTTQPRKDYGVLLRLRNPHHPEHWLFVCAGLGEWGTSGSTYYLADRWFQLYKQHRTSNFAKVVEVDLESDESAREVYSAQAAPAT
jgi:hypothetical protein